LDGHPLDVLRREPPHVTGDGVQTIHELITTENERRLAAIGMRGIDLLRVDLDCLTTLAGSGLSLEHVPDAGTRVAVKTVTNQNCADDNRSLGTGIGAAVLEESVRAAAVLGVRLAGVDVITTDPSRPLLETGGAILEVNTHPGLHHHRHVTPPSDATHVTVPVLETLLARSSERR
jgi:cyanophycin synthetase